jgi:hypothetical protein
VSESLAGEIAGLTHGAWAEYITCISITEGSYLDLIGVVTGDVNGSWVAEAV